MISYDHFLTLSFRHQIVSSKFYKIYSQHQNQLNLSVHILRLNLTSCNNLIFSNNLYRQMISYLKFGGIKIGNWIGDIINMTLNVEVI